jgi:hypothetical protein
MINIITILLLLIHPLSARFTCSCVDAPTGKGCGDILEVCDTNFCDGKCQPVNQMSSSLTQFLQFGGDGDNVTSFSAMTGSNIDDMVADKGTDESIDSVADVAVDKDITGGASAFDNMDGLNPKLTSEQIKEAQRSAALLNAHKNLALAEDDPLKYNGVRPNAAQPANIHVTMIYANNNKCQVSNISLCDWREYPHLNYGGDLPMPPKKLQDDSIGVTFMVSCIVCGENKMCTRPEFNANIVYKKTLLDGPDGLHTRLQLIDVAKEIGEIEKRCKRTHAPFDQRLNHLRNQHQGLASMFGVPPPVQMPENTNDDTKDSVSLLQMLRSQR